MDSQQPKEMDPRSFERGPLPEPPDWDALPFSPPDTEKARAALEQFMAERPCFVDLRRTETGLPAYLYGNLQDPQSGSPLDAAEAFLSSNLMMLAGLPEESIRRQVVEASVWEDDGARQVVFAQTNSAGVPIYGGNTVCSLTKDELASSRRLTLVTSTFYPVPVGVIDDLTWGEPSWLYSEKPGPGVLQDQARPKRLESPPDLREESREKGWLADRWILPYHLDEMQGKYRPIWRVVIVDKKEEYWLALVDAETEEVLFSYPLEVAASVQAGVYLTTQDALTPHLTTVTLDYGAGGNLEHADRAHVKKAGRFAEPPGASTNQVLSANAFFHARGAQNGFQALLAALSFSPAGSDTNPDPTGNINVSLESVAGSASYNPGTHTIRLFTGDPVGNFPVFEPGFDGEVIGHEFTHAIARYLNWRAFKFKNAVQRTLTGALDEGFGFYFPCTFAGNGQWAEYAFRAWAAVRNLAGGPTLLSDVQLQWMGDPTGLPTHAMGMWWAQIFWTLRANNQLGSSCDRLLLKSLIDLSGPLESDPQASAKLFGTALLSHAANSTEQNKIRAVFTSFGVNIP